MVKRGERENGEGKRMRGGVREEERSEKWMERRDKRGIREGCMSNKVMKWMWEYEICLCMYVIDMVWYKWKKLEFDE